MNIYAKKGDKVWCCTHEAGYPSERKTIKGILKIGEIYTIERTKVNDWNTDVWLQEFPDVVFNSVFFKDIEEKHQHSQFVSTNQETYSEASPLDYITSRIEFIISTCTDSKVKQGLEQALRVVKTTKQ